MTMKKHHLIGELQQLYPFASLSLSHEKCLAPLSLLSGGLFKKKSCAYGYQDQGDR